MRWRDALRFLRPARLEIGRGPQHMESGRADSRSFPQPSLMSKKVRAAKIKLKRAYEAPAASDGTRILVDRLWPRGVKKADAAIEEWMKDVAPSSALRKWFGHDPARWQEFRRRYLKELREHPDALERLRALARQGPITLVFAAHDEAHNDAVVLRDVLVKGA